MSKPVIGWKAIGKYFSVHQRTARRWHKELPMPIYRLTGNGQVRTTVRALSGYKANRRISPYGINYVPSDRAIQIRINKAMEEIAKRASLMIGVNDCRIIKTERIKKTTPVRTDKRSLR